MLPLDSEPVASLASNSDWLRDVDELETLVSKFVSRLPTPISSFLLASSISMASVSAGCVSAAAAGGCGGFVGAEFESVATLTFLCSRFFLLGPFLTGRVSFWASIFQHWRLES